MTTPKPRKMALLQKAMGLPESRSMTLGDLMNAPKKMKTKAVGKVDKLIKSKTPASGSGSDY